MTESKLENNKGAPKSPIRRLFLKTTMALLGGALLAPEKTFSWEKEGELGKRKGEIIIEILESSVYISKAIEIINDEINFNNQEDSFNDDIINFKEVAEKLKQILILQRTLLEEYSKSLKNIDSIGEVNIFYDRMIEEIGRKDDEIERLSKEKERLKKIVESSMPKDIFKSPLEM